MDMLRSQQHAHELLNTPSPSEASPASQGNTAHLENYARQPRDESQTRQQNLMAEQFLDPEVFQHAELQVPALHLDSLVTDEVVAAVGGVADLRVTAQKHFVTVHIWMPVISKQLFSKFLLKRLTEKRAEVHLLLLAMKLSGDEVTTPRTELYELTKNLQLSLENSGVLSLLMIQSSILIACYEMGHGIYPAAYLSISQCARHAIALGLETSIGDRRHLDPKLNALDLEECRRVWWAILAMDRCVPDFSSLELCVKIKHSWA